jgi:hypothetical protein
LFGFTVFESIERLKPLSFSVLQLLKVETSPVVSSKFRAPATSKQQHIALPEKQFPAEAKVDSRLKPVSQVEEAKLTF